MERAKIMVGHPGAGLLRFETAQALFLGTRTPHEVLVQPSLSSGGNFNRLWCTALNLARKGVVTHFAMLHADVWPFDQNRPKGWLDVLVDELERLKADLISVAIAIKDPHGLTSSGIGDLNDRWCPFKRFTVPEIGRLPETFDAADAGYPGMPLLHNNGMWMADLRKEVFHKPMPNGDAPFFFELHEKIAWHKETSQWVQRFESEDWVFSRKLFDMGAQTYITRKVQVIHLGEQPFPNFGDWGDWQDGDEATAFKWRKAPTSEPAPVKAGASAAD